MTRAVVIGAGPNGLAAAITLARAGIEVEVREAVPSVGGGLRSAELTLPGYVHDVCSAIHPLALASPFFAGLELPVDWVQPPAAAAHPFDDGSAVTLERSVGETAEQLGEDAEAYARLLEPLVAAWPAVRDVLLGGYPPGPGAVAALVRALGARPLADAVRLAGGDAAGAAARLFRTERGRGLFAGHAAHSILPLERRPSAGFGLALSLLGHAVGWGFPRGGAQGLADALAQRLRELGGEIRVATPVDELPRVRLVLADVTPLELARLAGDRLPPRYRRALVEYRHGPGAFKLDWALDGPIPWSAPACARAGTVHLGGTLREIAGSERAVWNGELSPRPFVLLAQHTLFDASRAPAGQHTAWAYCHVPHGSALDATERIESQVERFAPGFRARILARHASGPRQLEATNRNDVGGDINGGAMDLSQLFARPVLRRIPYRTPLTGVYLCSASTPPGGGVHGLCGYAAARAALSDLAKSS